MCPPTLQITLEVEPASDPIRGRMRHDGGTQTFYGWLELADALRSAAGGSLAVNHGCACPQMTEGPLQAR